MKQTMCAIFAILLFGVVSADASDRFTVNGDGTVTDHRFGLMWAETDNQGNISWQQANQWVRFTFPFMVGGVHDGWRLPTVEELESLMLPDAQNAGYETDCGHTVRIIPEIRLSCGWVWTADTSGITAQAYNFEKGYAISDRMTKTRGFRALPVRTLK